VSPSRATATCTQLSFSMSDFSVAQVTTAAAGNAATRLTSLDLRGSAYAQVPACCITPRPAFSQESVHRSLEPLSVATRAHIVVAGRPAGVAAPRHQLSEAAAYHTVLGRADAGGNAAPSHQCACCCSETAHAVPPLLLGPATGTGVTVTAGRRAATGVLPPAGHALAANAGAAAAGLEPCRHVEALLALQRCFHVRAC
jgi:hypothetical protein